MRQKIAALVTAVVVAFSVISMSKEKLSATEGGSILMACLAYWSEPPASPGTK